MRNTKICIHTKCLFQAPRRIAEPAPQDLLQVIDDSDSVSVVLWPVDTLDAFEDAALSTLKNAAPFRAWILSSGNRFIVWGTIVLSFMAVAIIGMIGSYQNLVYDYFFKGEFQDVIGSIILLTFGFIFTLLIALAPSALTPESGNLSRYIENWWSTKKRRKRRLEKILKECIKTTSTTSFHIWNSCSFDENSWVWEYFVPSLTKSDLTVHLYIRETNRKQIFSTVDRLSGVTISTDTIDFSTTASPKQHASQLWNLFKPEEKIAFECLYMASALFPQALKPTPSLTPSYLISPELADAFQRKYFQGTTKTIPPSSHLQTFLDDFLLLKQQQIGSETYWLFNSEFFDAINIDETRDECSAIIESNHSDISSFVSTLTDPVASLVLYGLSKINDAPSKQKTAALTALINNSRKNEIYALIDQALPLLRDQEFLDTVYSSVDQLRSDSIFNFFRWLDIDTLENLFIILERSGKYNLALSLGTFLAAALPFKYSAKVARIHERQGESRYSLSLIESYNEIAIEPNTHNITDYVSRLNIMAWTIVSGRLTDKKQTGMGYLKELSSLIQHYQWNIKDTNELWHFHNNVGNYAEWDDQIDDAIEHHKKALGIPAVDLKWISGSYINLGIAYRFRYTQSKSTNDLEVAQSNFEEGLKLKRFLGDNDELPIALHNYAWTLLEFNIGEESAEKRMELAQRALAMVDEGLDILTSCNSSKKLGFLLAEGAIAESIIEAPGISNSQPPHQKAFINRFKEWASSQHDSAEDLQKCQQLLRKFQIGYKD